MGKTTEELFVNGELALSRKQTYGKGRKTKPAFTSRPDYHNPNYFNIRNVLDIKGFLEKIRDHWHTYVRKVHRFIQKGPVKKLIVTGIFTVLFGFYASTANAGFIQEYTYEVKSGDKIEEIAAAHGVTAQEILDANDVSSIDGKKILLPKVENRTVAATILNIRAHPGTESSKIGKFKNGDVVKVAFVENGWAGILIKGRLCFVKADYLTQKQAPDQPSSLGKTMYVTAKSLRVREEASTNSRVAGLLKLNDRVTVISISNGWAKFQFNGKTAFVSEAFLTPIQPVQENSSSVYVIKPGDNFTKISKELAIPVAALQELNPAADPTNLQIGQQIKIPAKAASEPNQITVKAQISGVDPQGTFRFITTDGKTYGAKATGNMINELFDLLGKTVTLTLEEKRGQPLTLLAIK